MAPRYNSQFQDTIENEYLIGGNFFGGEFCRQKRFVGKEIRHWVISLSLFTDKISINRWQLTLWRVLASHVEPNNRSSYHMSSGKDAFHFEVSLSKISNEVSSKSTGRGWVVLLETKQQSCRSNLHKATGCLLHCHSSLILLLSFLFN